MKVIKNINNNVSICVDKKGNELIAFGKGIGFPKPPYEITDLSKVFRTYYDVDSKYLDLLNQIDEEVFEIAAKTVDYARSKTASILDDNISFTLADHLQFSIKRFYEGMQMKFSMYYDLDYMNPEEVEIGEYAVKLVKDEVGVELPYEEVYGIALHFINSSSVMHTEKSEPQNKKAIDDITKMIETYFKMEIDKKGFNYSRFATHMEYLLKRYDIGQGISTTNEKLFDSLKEEFPDTYACADMVNQYFLHKLKIELNKEELLYLMLHINRLCAREDCYR